MNGLRKKYKQLHFEINVSCTFTFYPAFLMKGNLFLKLEAQTNSKNKPTFLNVNFLDTFCICSRKNEVKWCLCFNTSYITYFWYSLCRKLTKSLVWHGFGKIFTHAIWLVSPDTPHFCSAISWKTEISWFFLLMQNPEKGSDL